MSQRDTKDNENRRRRRDRPLGLSNRKGAKTKGFSSPPRVFGGKASFRVKLKWGKILRENFFLKKKTRRE